MCVVVTSYENWKMKSQAALRD